MRTLVNQLFIALALLVGVAIGFFASAPSPAPAAGENAASAARTIPDRGDEATIAALRRQVAELQQTLREKDAAARMPEDAVVTNAADTVRVEMSHRGPRQWLEDMKKTDPARYVQVTNQMAQWRRQRAEQAHSTVEFLSSLDVSGLDAAAAKTHADLQRLILRRAEIEDQLHQEDLADEDRGRLMRDMAQTMHEMFQLNGMERRNLFDATARALGFDGQDVEEITDTLQSIVDATSFERSFRRGRDREPAHGR